MRLRELQRKKRTDLLWFLLGFVVVQIGLSLCVEWSWVAVRDHEYANLERILKQRRAESPGRPLVVALGSSRTVMALRGPA